jgi:hypothetical protein
MFHPAGPSKLFHNACCAVAFDLFLLFNLSILHLFVLRLSSFLGLFGLLSFLLNLLLLVFGLSSCLYLGTLLGRFLLLLPENCLSLLLDLVLIALDN